MNIWEIVGGIVVLALGAWGGWKMWKHIPREVAEAFMALAEAVEDDDFTREDLKRVVKEFGDIIAVIRKIF